MFQTMYIILIFIFSVRGALLEEGEPCTVPDTLAAGICISIEQCHYAKIILQLGGNPKFCGFKGKTTLVCCPLYYGCSGSEKIFSCSRMTFSYYCNNCRRHKLCNNGRRDNYRKCVSFNHCQYAKDLMKTGRNPEFCGYTEDEALICCPVLSGFASTGVRSLLMCSGDEGKKYLIVEGGKKVQPREFPHMVAVGYTSGQNVSWLCGGTLISHFFVLTAAHCATEGEYGSPKWVRFGETDLSSTTVTLPITEIHIHPEYTPRKKNNDIALLQVSEKIDFSDAVKPACLHTEKYIPARNLGAAGWGRQGLYGDPSTHLLKVSLKVVDFSTCSQRRLGISDETQICAGDPSGQDTCPGDSGGPLHYKVYSSPTDTIDRFVVAGVTSFGRGCGGENSLGVYTRVSAYLDWIENIVWPVSEFGKSNF